MELYGRYVTLNTQSAIVDHCNYLVTFHRKLDVVGVKIVLFSCVVIILLVIFVSIFTKLMVHTLNFGNIEY